MPPLGIFRGLGGSRHGSLNSLDTSNPKQRGLGSSVHSRNNENRLPPSDDSDLKKRLVEVADSQTEMEVEYLNIITSLNKEKEEARDEIQQRVRESSSLTEENQSLISKVSDLELKVAELETAKSNLERSQSSLSELRPTSSSSRGPRVFTFDEIPSVTRRHQELERIKEKLKSHSESNDVLNSKVQRIRDKYAKRRSEADDLSETGSIMTVGSTRSCISMIVASPRQHMVEVKKMELSYQNQVKINVELEKRIETAQRAQAETSQQLEELKKQSDERLHSHNKEIQALNSKLIEAKNNLDGARKVLAAGEDTRNDAGTTQDTELANVKRNLEDEISKVTELEEQIKEKENQIQSLKDELLKFSDTEKRLEELTMESIERLNAHNFEVDQLRSELSATKATLKEVEDAQTKTKDIDRDDVQNQVEEKSEKITELEAVIQERENEIRTMKSEAESHKSIVETIEKELASRNTEVEKLRTEFSETMQKLEEVEKAQIQALEGKESAEASRLTIAKKLEEESKKVIELESRIKEKEAKEQMMQPESDSIKALEKSDEQVAAYIEEIAQLRSELSATRDKMEAVEKAKSEVVVFNEIDDDEVGQESKVAKSIDVDSKETTLKLEEETKKVSQLESAIKEKESEMQKMKSEAEAHAKLTEELEKLKAEIDQAKDELKSKDAELLKAVEENAQFSEKCKAMELDFVVTQEKNARTWQEMEDLRDKYDTEIERNTKLQDELQRSQASDSRARSTINPDTMQLDLEKENVLKLQNELKQKDEQILELKSKMSNIKHTEDSLETYKNDLTSVLDKLRMKEEELVQINNEKFQSSSRLETIELDMLIMQEKNAKTYEELENLREKYDFEREEKTSLKKKLEEFSPENILAEAKIEHENSLKTRDSEIDELKKQLTDANVAKTEIELKLMDVMNDVIASQSTRDVMRDELETRLMVENEKAETLQDMIKAKEADMERMRKEFEDLRLKMQKETDSKRNEISELNGEVVEKASKLSERERDFVHIQAEMDELKLKHAAEVASLRKHIDESGANEREMEMMRMHNSRLEEEITSLKTELNRLHLHGNVISPDSSTRILRTRNEQLKLEVDKLQTKLRRMKRNVTRIEL